MSLNRLLEVEVIERRLEDIETKYSTITITREKDDIEYTEIDIKDLIFLIQNGFKQGKRVQELEDKLIKIRTVLNIKVG